jgi:hypothetical protein
MRAGPSERVGSSRFQTTFGGWGQKAMVVSTEGKGLGRTKSGDWQEEDRKGTTDDMSKA